MRIANLLRARTELLAVRAKVPPRIYTVEELKNNRWHFPDETFEVKMANIARHQNA